VLVSVIARGVSSRGLLRDFAADINLAALASFMPP
jgi:hypothetical protein